MYRHLFKIENEIQENALGSRDAVVVVDVVLRLI